MALLKKLAGIKLLPFLIVVNTGMMLAYGPSWQLCLMLAILVSGMLVDTYLSLRYLRPVEKGILTKLQELESVVSAIKLKTNAQANVRERNVRF